MSQPKGKQRSIHMDDETFETLERLAGEYKANNSTIVRMALIQFDRGSASIPYQAPPPAVAAQAAQAEAAREEVTKVTSTRDIAIPDPRVSSFRVAGNKVVGKVPRNDREDDGLDV